MGGRRRHSDVAELRRFAVKLEQERPTHQAACAEAWRNGQIEDRVHKLEFLEGCIFGYPDEPIVGVGVGHPR